MTREVSDKFVIILLILAICVSALGAYVIYDFSNNYEFRSPNTIREDKTTGSVTLRVVETIKGEDSDETLK